MHNNIDAKGILVETWDSKYAVCIEGRFHGWAFYKHPDGQWVTMRKATEDEIEAAKNAHSKGIKHKQIYSI